VCGNVHTHHTLTRAQHTHAHHAHTRIHTHTQTHTHTHIHTQTHTDTQTHVYTRVHARAHTHANTTFFNIRTRADITFLLSLIKYIHTHTHMHAGNGLFATRLINAGELISLYPTDALLV